MREPVLIDQHSISTESSDVPDLPPSGEIPPADIASGNNSGGLPPSPRPRRRCCGCAVAAFIALCLLAAVGNYMRQTSTGRRVEQRVGEGVRAVLEEATGVPGVWLPPQPEPHDLPDDYKKAMAILTPVMKDRFASDLERLNVSWPPARVRVLGLKAEREVELWVGNREDTSWKLLKTYPVLAASGNLGPKRRQGDKQVPEGIYRIVYHNPKSLYHLSLLLDYPNAADKARESEALADGVSLGGDICVHGSYVSTGCLAVGDGHIEEIFAITALADRSACDVVILPADFRRVPEWVESLAGEDAAVLNLYRELSEVAANLK